ncbi:unnamed protein product [Rodentolepis nana]|uniref:Uncharacterized protein n=1 Tax=Rodentolepis nana TaxID=102285 RepID=A0A3P7W462_RODNA|nr:unnamed protein product [Rodentolepis nana]
MHIVHKGILQLYWAESYKELSLRYWLQKFQDGTFPPSLTGRGSQ